MKLSSKGRYAVMAMVDLARHAQAKPVSLSDIATRQEISLSYLEQLFARLRRSGETGGGKAREEAEGAMSHRLPVPPRGYRFKTASIPQPRSRPYPALARPKLAGP